MLILNQHIEPPCWRLGLASCLLLPGYAEFASAYLSTSLKLGFAPRLALRAEDFELSYLLLLPIRGKRNPWLERPKTPKAGLDVHRRYTENSFRISWPRIRHARSIAEKRMLTSKKTLYSGIDIFSYKAGISNRTSCSHSAHQHIGS